ncbi:MAG: histidine phosphatase family protein [Gemmatimonadaceae bacterium]|jgi:probable phosphoglycerate mutase|nr:histidine phosphatase family protein [Gemmatimonadaceae bacterium]
MTTNAAPTRLIVVRHGQTEWNAAGRIQGHLNSRLDADGRAQAEALAVRLVGEPLAAIYTSDLGRTLETAAPTASSRMMDIVTDPRLRERHLGVFQGLTFAEAERQFPDMFVRYKARDLHVHFEHGESLVVLRERVAEVLTEIADRHAGEAVLVVTHGGVLDQIYRLATGMALDAPRTFTVDNASINRLVWDGARLRLTHWDDTPHEGPALTAEF